MVAVRPSRRLEAWLSARLAVGSSAPEPPGLEELTVVVLSYERSEYLLRLIAYWSGSAAQLLILDGSRRSLSRSMIDSLRDYPRIRYLHRPVGLVERFREAGEAIDTRYAVLGSDDEFHLRSGLAAAMEVLRSEPDLVACMGQSLGFVPRSGRSGLKYGVGYPHVGYRNDLRDYRDRLITASRCYNAVTCYAVTRAAAWRGSWGAVRDWSSVMVIERQQAASLWIHGGLVTVDDVYWMRSGENASVRDLQGDVEPFTYWWRSHKREDERRLLVKCVCEEAVRLGLATPADSRAAVTEAFDLMADGEASVFAEDETAEARMEPGGPGLRFAHAFMCFVDGLPLWLRDPLIAAWRRRAAKVPVGAAVDGLLDDAIRETGLMLKPRARSNLEADLAHVEDIVAQFVEAR